MKNTFYRDHAMTEKPENKKCSFGAFLDIIDDLQKTYNAPVSAKKAGDSKDKECLSCTKKIKSDAKVCPYCGKEQPPPD
jgi:hypothetical protein